MNEFNVLMKEFRARLWLAILTGPLVGLESRISVVFTEFEAKIREWVQKAVAQ